MADIEYRVNEINHRVIDLAHCVIEVVYKVTVLENAARDVIGMMLKVGRLLAI
jgi:hypothetical protein